MRECEQSQIQQKAPKVSVCVLAYQHEEFIGVCLQSIVSQITDFDFEVIVGVDSSADRTRDIALRFAEQHPDLIHLVLHEKQVGPTQNYFSVHGRARGEYVCHCDGDDYWLPGKLQWQAGYLDEHPEIVQIWHRMLIIDENNRGRVGMPVHFKGYFGKQLTFRSLALSYGLVGQQSSQMYRRAARQVVCSDRELLDYYIALSIAKAGYSITVDRVFGVYRMHNGPKSINSTTKGQEAVAQCLVDLAADYSTDKDLKMRLHSHLAVYAMMSFFQQRPARIIWRHLRRQHYPIYPRYFLQALRIFMLHTNGHSMRLFWWPIKQVIRRIYSKPDQMSVSNGKIGS